MKAVSWMGGSAAAAVVVMSACMGARAEEAKADTDFQALANKSLWSYFEDRAFSKYSVEAVAKPYRARMSEFAEDRGGHSFVISKGEADLYSWNSHGATVFAIADDVLYYSDFNPHASGCSVIAYDLAGGKQLWKTHLKGLGPIEHSAYSNHVNIAADAKAVRIFGFEAAGGYVEFVDRKTGKTVGHRIFKREEMKAAE